ncbi:phenylalanine--tRNA ligase subunit beta [uncultured Porphyromonas sp.]|uniref:phenylalanine--tRNA ligase subunit beta n=1 Tax=uncultured Porphyromonas sp. TaxID=159274 RepID=UPI002614B566|nr:phenylalanine--tRNA ligase subunit beta [uncultured Porphyromonas sp.]
MNISFNWLQQYLPRLEGSNPNEVAETLTAIGLEVAGVEETESVRGGLRGVVIGRTLTCIPHPNSDHLHVCTVDLGEEEPVQIVCGAPNVAAGQTVVVATVGTTLYGPDGEAFKIKKSKLRGEPSMGMICSQVEIGMGADSSGIWVLDDETVKPGTPAADYFDLASDTLIEIDITPNRVDATSHYGVARDLAAYYSYREGKVIRAERPTLTKPQTADAKAPAIQVEMEVSAEDCPRYQGVTIRGLKCVESPDWLKERLQSIGQRPINAVVDVTNFVLHEIGQPLHAFDAQKIAGGKLRIAHLPAGTPFTTLDGVEHKLTGRENMICDSQLTPLCIGGVMGGLDSGVTMETTDIFIEAANFNPTITRRAARSHGLSTDSSFRFERGLDPEATDWALQRAVSLILDICGGTLADETVDHYRKHLDPVELTISTDYVSRAIGRDLTADQLQLILEALEMSPKAVEGDAFAISVPRYRYDVTRPVDVVEEVLRIYGYNAVPLSGYVHASLSKQSDQDHIYHAQLKLSELLTGFGYREILNNSLTSRQYFEGQKAFDPNQLVPVENPLSQELNVLRPTLLVGGLETISDNVHRKQPYCALYEWGNVYRYKQNDQATTPLDQYTQAHRLGLWLSGTLMPNSWTTAGEATSPYMLRGVVEKLLAHMGFTTEDYSVTTPAECHDLWSDVVCYTDREGESLAYVGVVSNYWLTKCDIKQPVYYAELYSDTLMAHLLQHKVVSTELSKYPTVKRDLALLIDNDITYEALARTASKAERKLLQRIELFDVYTGKELPKGKKSYALSFYLRDDKGTLRDAQIDAAMKRIWQAIEQEYHATLR